MIDIASIPDVILWHWAWVDSEDTDFDPETMNREDEVVRSCTVEQAQDGHAMINLTVLNPRVGLYNTDRKQWGYLSATIRDAGGISVVPWVKAQLLAWPSDGDGRWLKLSLKAIPSDWLMRQEEILAAARVAPWYDEAFIGSRDPITQPEVNLEARPEFVHCDRLTHAASLVSILDGPSIDIGEAWVGDSLGFSDTSQDALDVVIVEVSARWRQPVNAFFPVTPIGYTLTPQALWKSMPKKGDVIGGSYKVISVQMSFQMLGLPDAPSDVSVSSVNGVITEVGTVAGIDEMAYVPNFLFAAGYTLGVSYEIEREENYKFTLAWKGQKTNRIDGAVKSETLPMQISMEDVSAIKRWRPNRSRNDGELRSYGGLAYISTKAREEGLSSFIDELNYHDPVTGAPDPYWERYQIEADRRYQSTFFGTERGNQALQHAVLAAHARMAVSRSANKTSFDLIKPALGLQVDCSMMMSASEIPMGGDGTVYGKVSRWTLTIAEGGIARFNVEISSIPGSGTDPTVGGDVIEDELIIASEGALNSDGEYVNFEGKDWAGIYWPIKDDYPVDAPAWWPAGRNWPPSLYEDTFGLYTHGRSKRFEDLTSQIFVTTDGDPDIPLPPIANPYDAEFPVDPPDWWPVISSPYDTITPGEPFTGTLADDGEYAFAWPPGSPSAITSLVYYYPNSDPFQFYKVPPENDEFDGSGGVRGESSSGGEIPDPDMVLEPSANIWDKIPVKQTVIPYLPPVPATYLAPPRVAQPSDEPDYETGEIIPGFVEIKNDASEQGYILTHPEDPHWDKVEEDYALSYDPFDDTPAEPPARPGEANFDPIKALELLETEVILHLISVNGISSSIDFEAIGIWNGPKQIDTESAAQ